MDEYSSGMGGAKAKRHRSGQSSSSSSSSASTERNCSSYFLRPLPQKNYSQFTFTI